MRHHLVLPLVLAVFALLPRAGALAAPLSKSQIACLTFTNAVGARVASAAADTFRRCIGRACVGRLPSGQTVEQCLAAGSRKTAAARAKTRAVFAARCTESRPFGPTNPEVVNDAFAHLLRLHAVFGPSLDAALIDAKADRAGARCQRTVAQGITKIALAKIREFNDCAAAGAQAGTIVARADLRACASVDPNSRVAAVRAAAQKLANQKCAGVPVAQAFPGECAAAPLAGLFACLETPVECGACLALNGADRLQKTCHQSENGVAQVYCGDPPVTEQSTARQWDEALLAAIRIDTPRPTVHARNLFHLSAAMWDAWRAYGGGGTAFLTDESPLSDDPARDRAIAVSFAAYRLLAARFQGGPGAATTQLALWTRLHALGFDADYTATAGDAPAAVGNRIGAAILAHGQSDGANEQNNYADPTYTPANLALIVKQPGTVMTDPNRWQPLALDQIITQNGIPVPDKVQSAIGMRWNHVSPFALTRANPTDVYIDPGPPPQLGGVDDAGYKEGARRVLELSSQLDPNDGAVLDISPGALGNNPLGTNAGTGHPLNPATGQPYASHVVPRGDFLRVLTEFWADGPESETPPGHWNVLANEVSDVLPALQIGGGGPVLDRLEWDVKLYFTLNGAVHDAAIVSWGLKRQYDSVRPISMIRYLAGKGQSTDPGGPAYASDGLPLQPGLIEVISPVTTAPGERHEHLASHEGEIAIYAYGGPPVDPTTGPVGATWQRGVAWIPYQRRTFVTPAFPGFTSGHSTFSRAAAEVMTQFTGDAFVPGGLGEHHAPANVALDVERGPSVDVMLQWATYYDAADQAGQSRLAGGIHVSADDFNGRITGSQVGGQAFAKAMQYFAAGR